MTSSKSNSLKNILTIVKPDKFIYIIDYYLCNIIHNPLISSGFILFSYGYYILTTSSLFEDSLTYDIVYSDILSNLINIIAICRFLFNLKFNNSFGEGLFFIFQTIGSFYIFLDNDYDNGDDETSIFLKVCVYCQIILPSIIILISYYINDFTIQESITLGNNNFIPFLLSYSIKLMNNQLWFNSTIQEFIYSISILSLKFYLIYQFVLHEYLMIYYDGLECFEYSLFYPTNESNSIIIKNDEILSTRKQVRFAMIKNWCVLSVSVISIIFDIYIYIV